MKTEATKGPYRRGKGGRDYACSTILGVDNYPIASVGITNPSRPEEDDANAYLLAASWELREVLTEVIRWTALVCHDFGNPDTVNFQAELVTDARHIGNLARDALALTVVEEASK